MRLQLAGEVHGAERGAPCCASHGLDRGAGVGSDVLATAAGAFAATPVAVQLVLAVDVSGSVSQDRFELQREGYAAAFRDARVLQAIRSTSTGSIAVAMVQWTGPALHVVAVDWTLIERCGVGRRASRRRSRRRRARCSVAARRSAARSTMRADMLARAPFQRAAAGDRRVGRWREQPRPSGRGCAGRGGTGRRGDQWAADPDARARAGRLLPAERDRRARRVRHRGAAATTTLPPPCAAS